MAKVLSFHTTINNTRISQYNYVCSVADDWIVKKDKLKGSCIFTANEYYYNFTWIEDFTDTSPMNKTPQAVSEFNVDEGLDLNTEVIYGIQAYCADVNLTHHIFAVTQKTLKIAAGGITLN